MGPCDLLGERDSSNSAFLLVLQTIPAVEVEILFWKMVVGEPATGAASAFTKWFIRYLVLATNRLEGACSGVATKSYYVLLVGIVTLQEE